MIRAIVVADSGAAMATLSLALRGVANVEIVRYASGGARVTRVVRAAAPDVVVLAELRRPADTLARLTEIRSAAPGAAVVVIAAEPGAGAVDEVLRRGAAAVLPGGVDSATLELALREVLESNRHIDAPTSMAA